ncbi:DUF969 domain-containing protein [Aneurinibacillus tyrosinisolvens]|uniref:DUF969 domain-containing protein n=1 Tax=Aneurinibacillus tyrosinisolvens TaxID=1443435 RepID=UPI00063F9486|nr:DUF969 domain-containing protein [Aneurinibacillus tyrosinisolvens]
MIKLIGILVVALGFAFRFNTLLVVMVSGIVTGMVAGMSFNQVITLFGNFFIENRYMSLPIILTLPVIGILERYGLKERAEMLIMKAKNATTGRVLLTYLFIREVSAAIGLNIGGHAQTVRPLVVPMAEGAAVARYGEISEKTKEDIKSYSAAAENTGWFFGEDIFIATGAILLMSGFFKSIGMNVGIWDMALWGIPTALTALLVSWIRFNRLDKRIAREAMGKGNLVEEEKAETKTKEAK